MARDPDGLLTLTVVTPERSLVDRVPCDSVTLPGEHGQLGILPGHTPLIALLGIGSVVFRAGEKVSSVAVKHGFAEIAGDAVRVLADSAATRETIDASAVAKERDLAERRRLEVESLEQLEAVNQDVSYAETRIEVARIS